MTSATLADYLVLQSLHGGGRKEGEGRGVKVSQSLEKHISILIINYRKSQNVKKK